MLGSVQQKDLVVVSSAERLFFKQVFEGQQASKEEKHVVADVLVLMKRFFISRDVLSEEENATSFAISVLIGDVFPVASYSRILESSLNVHRRDVLTAWVNDTFLDGLKKLRRGKMKEDAINLFLLNASKRIYE